MRTRRAPLGGLALVAAVTLGLGCAPAPTAVIRPDPCRDVIDRAAVAREVPQQIRLLDSALLICRDADAFTDALSLHPGAIAVAASTFIQRRCEDPPDATVALSSICQEVAPVDAAGQDQDPADDVKVYIGRTLDGRSVELRSTSVRFSEGRPAGIVEVVEVGTRQGCEGLLNLYTGWVPLLEDPGRGDELSVYAQHAVNLMQSLDCEPPPTPAEVAEQLRAAEAGEEPPAQD